MILTAACRPDVRHALLTHPGVLLVGRSADPSGAEAMDLGISGVYTAADHLARREGVDVRHLLPTREVLVAQHRTAAAVERMEAIDDATVAHRWSVWTPPVPKETVLPTSGSARAVTASGLLRPVPSRIARLAHETRQSMVFTRSLTRIGRGYPGALIDVLQAIGVIRKYGPGVGDQTTALAAPDLGMAIHPAIPGIAAREIAHGDRAGANQPRLPSGRWTGRRSELGGGAR